MLGELGGRLASGVWKARVCEPVALFSSFCSWGPARDLSHATRPALPAALQGRGGGSGAPARRGGGGAAAAEEREAAGAWGGAPGRCAVCNVLFCVCFHAARMHAPAEETEGQLALGEEPPAGVRRADVEGLQGNSWFLVWRLPFCMAWLA